MQKSILNCFPKFYSSISNLFTATRLFSSTGPSLASKYEYTHILVERKGAKNNVGFIKLNKPKMNTLSVKMVTDLANACEEFEADKNIGAIVLTGGEQLFTGGAEINEMKGYEVKELISPYATDFLANWDRLARRRLPVIMAVNGYCVGGGLEFSMAFDIIYAGENTKFGQPEINIGICPGFGGTQRLIKQVGKSKAMEMILTGNVYSAREMEQYGLVSKVLPADQVIPEAIKCGERIAQHSKLAVMYAKRAVNAAYELPLSEGITYERQLFYTLFASHDKQEGMRAFLEKRAPKYKDC